MTETTVVHLLRHGEVSNPDHILYGRLPGFRLSDLGIAQAEAAAQWLAQRPIGYLSVSPLERAQQTVRPLAELTGLTPVVDDRLIEAANALQGRPVNGIGALLRNPGNWRYFRNPFRPSWGEPYHQIAARVLAAARSARRRVETAGPGLEAVCVTHQLPVVAARRRVQGLRLAHDPRRRQCALASVTSFTFADDEVVAVDYHEPASALGPGAGTGA